MPVLDEIIALVHDQLRLATPLDPDTRVLSSGLVDSFRLAVLLSDLETRYHVRIPLAAIGADNFDTPRQMMAFIMGRR
jgi:acyl carrier protein